MEVVTGAMGSLLPKLVQLLDDEYNLHKRVKKDVESLTKEMKSMHAALRKVADVPRDQLDDQLKLWADEVRELSYNMEDVVDTFLVRVDGSEPAANSDGFKGLMKKMTGLFKKGKAHHRIADAIKEINKELQDVANRRGRYTVDNIEATPRPTTIDPRLRALYTEATELVGIYGKRDQELMRLLSMGDDDVSINKLKIVSVVGFGGLGKTTLVKAVYDKIKGDFDCKAFVPIGRNPDVKKIFRDILIDLDKQKYTNINLTVLDERQLIEEILEFLHDKRYLIIIDDIWDQKSWKVVKLAFSNMNNLSSRLITTTRIASVSKTCCSSANDSIYQMKPLSDDDSQMLFYKRIFSHRNCPSEFEEVSRDILKKCGGVPLAIITIASLLASDQRMKSLGEWQSLLQSIGRGLTEDASLEEMQRILSFSYYDLPSYLKTCLLYLSIYPEDCYIKKDQVIWKWIAERFVHCEEQESSLFELGETYFNELINRSMIQPLYDGIRGMVEGCRVHDMVHDLICLLASEENFVTVLNGTGVIKSSQSNVRRLSLQNRNEDYQATPIINSMSMSQVRSIAIYRPAIKLMPPLPGFDVLRVLDLSGCDLAESGCQLNLRNVGNLFHLRYLGLANTGIRELPEDIGDLQFLQVLDVGRNHGLKELPSTVCKLNRLMFLNVDPACKILPGGLENLTCMEVLKTINATLSIVQELRNLAKLRELKIVFSDSSLELEEVFVESLCKLRNIQSVVFKHHSCFGSMDLLGEGWAPSRHLRIFDSYWLAGVFSALPAWIKRDPSHLSNLSNLRIRVKVLKQEDIRILGRLPALHHLCVQSTRPTERRLVIGADEFRCMINFHFYCGPGAHIVFERGALPRVEHVELDLGVRVVKDDGNGDFDFGLQGNLLSLRDFTVWIYRHGATVGEAKKAEAAVRRALHGHPNHPHIYIQMEPDIPAGANDDDLCEEEEQKEED